MGYTTDFYGEFDITPALKPEHKAYLEAFAFIRHMARDEAKAAELPDPVREAVGLPVGPEGCYYVGSANDGNFGQTEDASVTNSNQPPGTQGYMGEPKPGAESYAQPGLWCQWTPGNDGTTLRWDEGEKFYEYEAWLGYLIEHFLAPWGYTVSGEVEWQGEERDDAGLMVVENNELTSKQARRVYE